MADLVLGPLLRAVEGTRATVWVEADGPCEVRVSAGPARGGARTTKVGGGHYALVVVEGVPEAGDTPYSVELDGATVWPEPTSDLPVSTIRTADRSRPLTVVFGSCRIDAPVEAPWDGPGQDDGSGQGVDALDALARRLAAGAVGDRPDAVALLGDQLYADLVLVGPVAARSPRRGAPPPGSVADLTEYQDLYRSSWAHPHLRWLLSTVPSVMIFDDHDVVDDWNLSAAWLAAMNEEPWWDERMVGALVSYWVYQHWGNLPPSALEADPLATEVAACDDATALLRARTDEWRPDRGGPGTGRWSTSRDLVGSATARLLTVDTRNSRSLDEERRALVEDDELEWVAARARVDRDGIDHLLLGSSLPWLLPPGVHDMERWAGALAAGRWGPPGRRLAEWARRAGDLEHWASFGDSFDRLASLLRSVAAGQEGTPPSSVLVLSGDVHFSYVAPADLGAPGARVVQLVSSPLRNGVPDNMRRALTLSASRLGTLLGRLARRTALRDVEPVSWGLSGGPWFGNSVATLTLDGATARVRMERAVLGHDGQPDLITMHDERLAGPAPGSRPRPRPRREPAAAVEQDR